MYDGLSAPIDRSTSLNITVCPPHRSRFEAMAAESQQVPRQREDPLSVLLGAASPTGRAERAVLQPLWAEEALHRAYNMLRLTGQPRESGISPLSPRLRLALACDLAANYRELSAARDVDMVPCAAPLRDIVTDLGALFGAGDIVVSTTIERVALPGYKRRALVLAASELVINALTHAFCDGASGRIEVSLRGLGSHACLRVSDDGIGFAVDESRKPGCTACGPAYALADLLEADLTYCRTTAWTTIAEISFPLPRAALPPAGYRARLEPRANPAA